MQLQRVPVANRQCSSAPAKAAPLLLVAQPHARPVNILTRATNNHYNNRLTQHRHRQASLVVVHAQPPAAAQPHAIPEEANLEVVRNKIIELAPEVRQELNGCSVYLVGMMGSGKSTVGRMLASSLQYELSDSDHMVEVAHGNKPVSEIFKEMGQDYFRQCETNALKELGFCSKRVVATGGGAVIKPENWTHMQRGVVVWLHGPVDLLARRVAKDGLTKRPLLVSSGAEQMSEDALFVAAKEKLITILADRTKFYSTADLQVSLEGFGKNMEMGAPTDVILYRLLSALQQQAKGIMEQRALQR